jgi:negative regulator of flagellin synthesis FlgM
MKIDFNTPVASQDMVERSGKQASNTVAPQGPSVTEDRATLSNTHTPVQTMVSQSMQSPGVRSEKVDALRQQIASGEYKADPGKIAEGIIAESAS